MIRVMALALALLLQDGVTLKYAIDKSEKDEIASEMSFGIKIEGSETMVNYIRMASPFFSIEKVETKIEGTRRITAKKRQKFESAGAKLTGVYDDEKFEFDFKAGETPEDLGTNKFKQMMWYLSMGGRSFTLEADGSYVSDDENQEAWGEVMDIIALGIVRMPDKAVKAGDSWTKEWKTENTQKDNGGRFALKQISKLEKVEEKDGKKLATIASDLTAELVDFKKDANADKQETKAEAKIKVVLELETGRVVSSEGSGKIVGYYQGVDENGDAQKLTITMPVSGKIAVK